MFGPEILVRTLSKATRLDQFGNRWQYHPPSDHHSKVACWGIVFDLLRGSPLLKQHVARGLVHFGINHEMRDFVHDRKKNLDLFFVLRLQRLQTLRPSRFRQWPTNMKSI